MIGLALYWAEGRKDPTSSQELSNTDPAMLNLYARWAKTYFPGCTLNSTIRIPSDGDKEQARAYWRQALDPDIGIGAAVFSPNTKHLHGVCAVRVVFYRHAQAIVLSWLDEMKRDLSRPSVA